MSEDGAASDGPTPLSRRGFLGGSAALAGSAALGRGPSSAPEAAPPIRDGVPRSRIALQVNGRDHELEVEDRCTLAELLRDRLDLTGTKLGCDRGECGSCTVLLDGRPVYACSQLAVWTSGRAIRTVEGLADGERLDPLQQAFIAGDAPQCGFCTAGQLMSARALLAANPSPTRDEVRAALTGNLCRCSNYERYVDSVLAAAGASGGSRE